MTVAVPEGDNSATTDESMEQSGEWPLGSEGELPPQTIEAIHTAQKEVLGDEASAFTAEGDMSLEVADQVRSALRRDYRRQQDLFPGSDPHLADTQKLENELAQLGEMAVAGTDNDTALGDGENPDLARKEEEGRLMTTRPIADVSPASLASALLAARGKANESK